MNFDPAWIQYEAEQDRREQEQDEMAVHWDSCKAEIVETIRQFGYEKVFNFIQNYQIQKAPLAPRPRPTTFNGFSID